jgi:hypothetical protein
MLNIMLSESDLAKLSATQREFCVQRIDHALDNDEQIRAIIASKFENTLALIDPEMKVRPEMSARSGQPRSV